MTTRCNPEHASSLASPTSNPLAADLDAVLQQTRTVWEDLRGQRLFITGGTGFVGTWLLESFCWANDCLGINAQATVLTRNPERFCTVAPHLAYHPAVEVLPGDVRSFSFPVGKFSHVIHGAADTRDGSAHKDHRLLFNTIVQGTERVLEFAIQAQASTVLFTSSGAVYGRQPVGVTHITEDFAGAPDPCDVASTYGEAKRAAELQCALFVEKGLPVKIARCFTFVGPYLPLTARYAVGNFVAAAKDGKAIVVEGNPATVRSYMYAGDMAAWLWAILTRGQPGRPYNVGSEQAVTMGELAGAVARRFGHECEVQFRQDRNVETAANRYVPSTRRASKELGLAQTVELDEALKKYVRFVSAGYA